MNKWMVSASVLALSVCGVYASGQSMSVQVKETVLRDKPSFLGATVAKLSYGDQVVVSDEQSGWSQAGAGGVQGWVHTSALTRKKITPVAGGGQVGTVASGDELALAGKGFSKEVEAEYKAQNKEVDFTEVDVMEKIVIPEQEMRQFLTEGSVAAGKGGAM